MDVHAVQEKLSDGVTGALRTFGERLGQRAAVRSMGMAETIPALVLHDSSYHSTGDFCAGIAGWLGCKIIGVIMNDDRSVNDLVYGKPICQKQRKRKSAVFK